MRLLCILHLPHGEAWPTCSGQEGEVALEPAREGVVRRHPLHVLARPRLVILPTRQPSCKNYVSSKRSPRSRTSTGMA